MAGPIQPPDYDQRVLVVGQSGTGKTMLLRALLGAGYARWVVIDPQGDFWPDGSDYSRVKRPPWADPRAWQAPRILYRPEEPQLREGRSLDAVIQWLYSRQRHLYDDRRRRPGPGTILVVEEAFKLSKTGHTRGLSDAAVSGRGLNLGLWVASQRPRWIPVEVRSEANRLFVFPLGYEDDEKEVLRYAKGALDLSDLQQESSDHSFWELAKEPGGRVTAIHRKPLRRKTA